MSASSGLLKAYGLQLTAFQRAYGALEVSLALLALHRTGLVMIDGAAAAFAGARR